MWAQLWSMDGGGVLASKGLLHGMLRVAHAYCDCKQQPHTAVHTEIELHKNINSNYQTFSFFFALDGTKLPSTYRFTSPLWHGLGTNGGVRFCCCGSQCVLPVRVGLGGRCSVVAIVATHLRWTILGKYQLIITFKNAQCPIRSFSVSLSLFYLQLLLLLPWTTLTGGAGRPLVVVLGRGAACYTWRGGIAQERCTLEECIE